jgi:D-cysteine desulfhydrase family pyridoxal phosphate-dependent enzyme
MTTDFRRLGYSRLPTRIEPLKRLSRALQGPNLFIKRDDCTGVGMGGNKCRKLDYLIAEAIDGNADTVVTVGGIQSNHVRQTAAFAARAGLRCEAVLERVLADAEEAYRTSGNLMLTRLLGANTLVLGEDDDLQSALDTRCAELRAAGRRPYVIPMGGSNATGALGYVDCADEILAQSRSTRTRFDWVVLATGSCGTQAGLVSGFLRNRARTKVKGYSVSPSREQKLATLEDLVRSTMALLKAQVPLDLVDRLHIDDRFFGSGYGHVDARATEAIRLLAREESMLLDPVYTGKAMAGLIQDVRDGVFQASENVLFVHTGGAPALFAYPGVFAGPAPDHPPSASS